MSRLEALTKTNCTYKIFTMLAKSGVVEFEWDKWNLRKSYFKHGVTPKETEEIFVDEQSIVLPDVKHSQTEERDIIVGKTLDRKDLFVVFVYRKTKIRVISARRMHRKEVLKYKQSLKLKL